MKLKERSLKEFLIHAVIAVCITTAISLLFFYVYLPSTTNHGETITVPKLVGQEYEDLEEIVGDYLRYEVSDSGYSEEYPAMTVLEQFPRAGKKVKENRKIYLTVNRVMPPTVPVPDVVDKSFVNAEAVLRSNELKMGKILYEASPYANLVLGIKYKDEEIEPFTRIPKGSTLDLVIGDGLGQNQIFDAPDLVKSPFENAKIILSGTGLNIGAVIVEGDTSGQEIYVLKQKPDPMEKVRRGEEFILWIGSASDTLDIGMEEEFLNEPDID